LALHKAIKGNLLIGNRDDSLIIYITRVCALKMLQAYCSC